MKNFKKILGLVVALAMILPLVPIQTTAAYDPNSVSVTSPFASSATNCSLSGTKVTATGNAPTAVYALASKWANEKLPDFLVATYQVSAANSEYALSMRFELLLDGESKYSTEVPLTRGYKYYSSIADISDYDGFADHVRVTFFTSCVAGDTIYFGGLCFASADTASEVASEQAKNANPVIAKYTEEELDSSKYELDKYMLPYWDTDIVYNEGVYPLLNSDGSMSPITLMFDIGKVLSVRSSSLKIEYKEGKDYVITDDGKLQILTTGSIPCVKYSEHYYTYNANHTYKMIGGGYVRFQEGPAIPNIQIAVTYVTEEDNEWTGFLPENQGETLSRTSSKLENGDDVNIVFFGDSITNGGNSSSCLNMEPYADIYTDMFEKELKNIYPFANITCANTSVSGGGWTDAKKNVDNCIIAYNPDLVVLALGTNDYQFNDSASEMNETMSYVVDRIMSHLPNCEVIIVSPMYSNPECFRRSLLEEYRVKYYDKAEEYDRIAVADVTEIHSFLLTRKSYTDMSANNVCHLNDYLARVYSQILIRTIMPVEASSAYKSIVKSRIENLVNLSLYYADGQAQITAIKSAATTAVDSAATTDECRRILEDAKLKAALVKTKEQLEVANWDYTNLIFNSSSTLSAFSMKYGVTTVYSEDENAAEILVTSTSDPRVIINYPSDKPVSANTYKYAVLTYKGADENSSVSCESQVFFATSSNSSFSEENSVKIHPEYDGDYHSEVIDLSKSDFWNGSILKIRIDPFNVTSVGDIIYISSLCLCETAEEAAKTASRREQIANGTYTGESSVVTFDSETSLEAIDGIGSEKTRGDVDGDGQITVKDVKNIKKIINESYSGSAYDEECADADGDGTISVKDYRFVKKILNGSVEPEIIGEISRSNVSFDSEKLCVNYNAEQKRYATFRANRPERAEYFVMVYKASGTDSSLEIYFGDDPETSLAAVETVALDGVWDKLIVKLPTSYTGNAITLDLDGISLSIDSVGFFETQSYAETYTYNKLWDRKSERVYTDNIVITFTEDTAKNIEYVNHAEYERVATKDILKLTVAENKIDPYAYLDLSSFNISADEYKYVVYNYMLPSTNSYSALKSEIFFCSGDITVPTAGCSKIFDVTKDDAYHASVIDLTSASYWSGDVYGIRLDFFASAEISDTAYVSSITFCKTLHDVELATK